MCMWCVCACVCAYVIVCTLASVLRVEGITEQSNIHLVAEYLTLESSFSHLLSWQRDLCVLNVLCVYMCTYLCHINQLDNAHENP